MFRRNRTVERSRDDSEINDTVFDQDITDSQRVSTRGQGVLKGAAKMAIGAGLGATLGLAIADRGPFYNEEVPTTSMEGIEFYGAELANVCEDQGIESALNELGVEVELGQPIVIENPEVEAAVANAGEAVEVAQDECFDGVVSVLEKVGEQMQGLEAKIQVVLDKSSGQGG